MKWISSLWETFQYRPSFIWRIKHNKDCWFRNIIHDGVIWCDVSRQAKLMLPLVFNTIVISWITIDPEVFYFSYTAAIWQHIFRWTLNKCYILNVHKPGSCNRATVFTSPALFAFYAPQKKIHTTEKTVINLKNLFKKHGFSFHKMLNKWLRLITESVIIL